MQCTRRIGRRSSRSGRGTTIWRSKRPGRSKCGVEDVGPVGRRDDDDALGRVEPVHLREHLVERLLPLVVTTAEPRTALAPDGVDLVDEDDGRRLLAGRLEEVAYPAGADADEHLHEVGTAHRQERDAGFAGHGPGQKGLARARGAHEQDPLGDLGADVPEPVGRLQEVHHFADLELHALVAGDVRERRPGPLGGVEPGPGPADRHDAGHLALGTTRDPDEDTHEQHDDDDRGQVLIEGALFGRAEGEVGDVLLHDLDVVGQGRVGARRRCSWRRL